MKNQLSAILAIGILIVIATACSGSFTTANISKLEFSKSNSGSPSATSFNTGEDIYAVATVSNTSEKLKIEYLVTAENVTGATKGQEVMKKSVDFEGARPLWLQFSLNAPGEYKVEATLSDPSGKKIDSKSGTVTIKGSAPSAPASTSSDKKDDKKDADKDSDDH